MLSIINDIPDFAVSNELNNFSIMVDSELTLEVQHHGSTVWRANYVPDSHNEVDIIDIFSVLEPFLIESPLQMFSYRLSAAGEAPLSKDFTILLCRCDVDTSGSSFVQTHFLTALDGVKITYRNSREFLYLTSGSTTVGGTVTPQVHCKFVDANNHLTEQTRALTSVNESGINKIDVAPSLFTLAGSDLVSYTVVAGSRRMEYRVVEPEFFIGAVIEFRNAFGCMETFSFAGLRTNKPKVERSAAYFSGVYHNYHVDTKKHIKVNSAFIPLSMGDFADDLAQSMEIYLLTGREVVPVTIVESETDRNNAPDALFSFSIEFIKSAKNRKLLPELRRIFDDTFDQTYN